MDLSPLEMETHLMELECVGVTAIRNAIAPPLLAELRAAHDEVCARIRRNVPPEEWSWENPDYPGVVDFFRAFEHYAVFEELLDLPTVFPVLAAALRGGRGREAGEPRCGGPVCQYLPAGVGSKMHWHRDGDLIRLTYLLADLPPDGGGTGARRHEAHPTHSPTAPQPTSCLLIDTTLSRDSEPFVVAVGSVHPGVTPNGGGLLEDTQRRERRVPVATAGSPAHVGQGRRLLHQLDHRVPHAEPQLFHCPGPQDILAGVPPRQPAPHARLRPEAGPADPRVRAGPEGGVGAAARDGGAARARKIVMLSRDLSRVPSRVSLTQKVSRFQWSDLDEEEYGFDLLDEAARRKELRRFEGAPSASL